MTAATEMRSYLRHLQAQRALGVAGLEEEIDFASSAYVSAAVTEIAMLRGELYGRPQG